MNLNKKILISEEIFDQNQYCMLNKGNLINEYLLY